MASRSEKSYEERAAAHANPLAARLLALAARKQSNLVVSADVCSSAALLDLADRLGPYMVVLKTHIDIIDDFSQATVDGLTAAAAKHGFLLFEDRKFVDIGATVQKQYAGGPLRISHWAHIVNCAVLAGPGIVDALAQSASALSSSSERGLLILAEMTSAGSLATGEYTRLSVELARKHSSFVMGFVSTRSLGGILPEGNEKEDFIVFTTGVNLAVSGDGLGQQYQTPASAVGRGADFIIAGRGIYAAPDPVQAARDYQAAGWAAYQERITK